MGKKLKWLAITVVFTVIVSSGYVLFGRTKSASPQAQQQAINEALEYHQESGPEVCADVITPAVHTKTGAKYTFNSSCLPPGWEAD